MGCDFSSKSPKMGDFKAFGVESLELDLGSFQNIEWDVISRYPQNRHFRKSGSRRLVIIYMIRYTVF